MPLAAGEACPGLDLGINISSLFPLAIGTRLVSPADCDRSCFGGSGQRRVLSFSLRLFNVGNTDVIFGSSGTPETKLQCGATYVEDALRYELRDENGLVVREQDGHLSFCAAQASGDFQSLERGYYSEVLPSGYGYNSCLGGSCGLDITAVPAGDYTLGIGLTLDAALFPDANERNDQVEIPLTLPPFPPDPTVACPAEENPLFGAWSSWERECGWQIARLESCTPRQNIALGCSACSGQPMLRVCEGSTACAGFGLAISGYAGSFDCPEVAFVCPASGNYTLLTASGVPAETFSCALQTIPLDPNPLAPCSELASSISILERDCGWVAAPAATCTPGQRLAVGCAECSGAPALRICGGTGACRYASPEWISSAIGGYTPSLERLCPLVGFACPSSGSYVALSSPQYVGEEASCDAAALGTPEGP